MNVPRSGFSLVVAADGEWTLTVPEDFDYSSETDVAAGVALADAAREAAGRHGVRVDTGQQAC